MAWLRVLSTRLELLPPGKLSSPELPWNDVVGVAAVVALRMSVNLNCSSLVGFVGLADVAVVVLVALLLE